MRDDRFATWVGKCVNSIYPANNKPKDICGLAQWCIYKQIWRNPFFFRILWQEGSEGLNLFFLTLSKTVKSRCVLSKVLLRTANTIINSNSYRWRKRGVHWSDLFSYFFPYLQRIRGIVIVWLTFRHSVWENRRHNSNSILFHVFLF